PHPHTLSLHDALPIYPRDLYTREGLKITASPLPIWDILLPILLALIIVDVATRRIAWDWASTKKMALAGAAWVQTHTTTRKVEGDRKSTRLNSSHDQI